MSDAILDKILGRRLEEHRDPVVGAESDGADDLGCFGWLRGVRERCLMLELRKKTGVILAVGYSWLEYAEFDPCEGITLHVPGRRISIRGRNLNTGTPDKPQVTLFQGLTRYRVPWIAEADPLVKFKSDKEASVIESITW